MSAPATFRVFISGVTSELASYRTEVARVLRRKGLEVCDQPYEPGPVAMMVYDCLSKDTYRLLDRLRDLGNKARHVLRKVSFADDGGAGAF